MLFSYRETPNLFKTRVNLVSQLRELTGFTLLLEGSKCRRVPANDLWDLVTLKGLFMIPLAKLADDSIVNVVGYVPHDRRLSFHKQSNLLVSIQSRPIVAS